MSSVKTDVNPSDIGTKALGRERFHGLRSMLRMETDLTETWQLARRKTSDKDELQAELVLDWTEFNDRHM